MDNKDFNDLFLKYYGLLCAFAYRYVHDIHAVEDIVQDVFCKFIERQGEIRHKEAIRIFLYQCTRNKALDYLKKINNHEEFMNNYGEKKKLDCYIDNLVINRGEEKYDYDILLNTTWRIISSLPQKTKEIFILSRKENMSNKEIANQLNITVKAVEKHITKALSILRQELHNNKLISFLFFM